MPCLVRDAASVSLPPSRKHNDDPSVQMVNVGSLRYRRGLPSGSARFEHRDPAHATQTSPALASASYRA